MTVRQFINKLQDTAAELSVLDVDAAFVWENFWSDLADMHVRYDSKENLTLITLYSYDDIMPCECHTGYPHAAWCPIGKEKKACL
jgi:hypothetical protein